MGTGCVCSQPGCSGNSRHYSVFAIDSGRPYQKYFRARFLNDLRASPPDLFIDTVVQGAILWPFPPKWTGSNGYESDPELADLSSKTMFLWMS